MNKKEIAEIKKQITKDDCSITKISGCYIDSEKNIRTTLESAFLRLPEAESFKYMDIFKKSLSGSIGKTLRNVEFSKKAEMSSGGEQEFMKKLLDSALTDKELLEQFYDKIVNCYQFDGNYFVVLAHIAYDVPKITMDNVKNEDASEEVYDGILCSICPVTLSKAGLHYDGKKNSIENKTCEWMVQAPQHGFLYPSFTDRTSNIHEALYFSKKREETVDNFLTQSLFGSDCKIAMSCELQKDVFNALIEESLGTECDFEASKIIYENLQEVVEENKQQGEIRCMDKNDIENLLRECGADTEQIERYEKMYEMSIKKGNGLMAENIIDSKKFDIKTPDVSIQISGKRTDLVETKIINNVPCLVIEINDALTVNGLEIKPTE